MEKDVELHRQPGCWLRSSHPLKECVIAHWSSDSAPKIQRGLKMIPKLGLQINCGVGERCMRDEVIAEAVVDFIQVRMPE